mmetsp:Transcript_28981/g.46543  ORF Transcript_28981/g.46543 Transcript_28981/m.46543 type:complete len:224 (+) Transcript_28981:374-1045(+)
MTSIALTHSSNEIFPLPSPSASLTASRILSGVRKSQNAAISSASTFPSLFLSKSLKTSFTSFLLVPRIPVACICSNSSLSTPPSLSASISSTIFLISSSDFPTFLRSAAISSASSLPSPFLSASRKAFSTILRSLAVMCLAIMRATAFLSFVCPWKVDSDLRTVSGSLASPAFTMKGCLRASAALMRDWGDICRHFRMKFRASLDGPWGRAYLPFRINVYVSL